MWFRNAEGGMRWFRAFVVVAVFGGAGLGCAKDVKSSIPPPSPDDKPLGTPHEGGSRVKQRTAK
jgi:hypothetical protein